MLSEFYYSRYAPRAISRELSADAAFASRWEQDRELYGALRQSIEKHFRNKNNSPFLRIDRVERSLPSPDIILKQGIRLSDRRWLSILPESMDLEAISTSQPNAEVRP